MSNLSLANILRIFLAIFVMLFLVEITYALEFGVSPPLIEINANGKNCKNITLLSDKPIAVKIEDYWSNLKLREYGLYNLSSNGAGLLVNYNNNILVDGKDKFEICFNVRKDSTYYGVLLFEPINKNVVVVVYVAINDNSSENYIGNDNRKIVEETVDQVPLLITGSVINEGVNFKVILLVILNLLFLILLTLVLILRNKRQRQRVL